MTPFSYESRREIGVRDKWSCACGHQFREGYMVEASHLDHDKCSGYYDEADNGLIECKECHLKRHIEIMLDCDSEWSIKSTRLQAMSCYKNGLMTYNYYDEHPEQLEEDRYKVITILENYGLNPDDFITPVKK